MNIPASGLVRRLNEQDLELVWRWRNHDMVRKWMMNPHPFSLQSHQQWFQSLSNSDEHLFFVFEINQQAEGCVSLHKIPYSEAYEWGFYVRPDAPKGTGSKLGNTALQHAFTELQIPKIFGQVISFNEKSLALHRKLGFQQEGCLRQHFQDERGIHDIFQFGLLQTEWLKGNS